MIQLTITMDDHGQVSVAGPLSDKVLCYGLLEQGKDAVRQFKEPAVQPASASDIVAVNGSRFIHLDP